MKKNLKKKSLGLRVSNLEYKEIVEDAKRECKKAGVSFNLSWAIKRKLLK